MKSLKNLCLFFRHGHTRYKQGNNPCPIDEAEDLAMPPQQKDIVEPPEAYAERVSEAIKIVAQKAEEASDFLTRKKPVAILSSPTGRGLHTARIIRNTLQGKGFRFKLPPITSKSLLTEVQNFEWGFFLPLAEGGQVTFKNHTFEIDRKLSNPENLTVGEYFFRDNLHRLPKKVKAKWPRNYAKLIESFEPAASVRIRSIGVIKWVFKEPETQFILVSHDALCGFMVKAWSHGKETELPRGGFLVLEGNEKAARVKSVGTDTDGNSSINILDPKVYGHTA